MLFGDIVFVSYFKTCHCAMDDFSSASVAKVMSDVNELEEVADFAQIFTNHSNIHNDSCSRNTLGHCIKNKILSRMKEVLEEEVQALQALNIKLTAETVTASTMKLISSPEMESVLCDVKEDVDSVLSSIPISIGSNVLYNKNQIQVTTIDDGKPQESGVEWVNPNIHNCPREGTISCCNCKEEVIEQHVMLSRLKKATLAEVFESSCWINVRTHMRQCLVSENQSIYLLALRLHARYLLSSSNVAMYESFMNLKSSVMNNFLDNKQKNVGRCSEGISLADFQTVKQMKTMRLISEFFRDGSKKYVRLPLKLLEEIIESLVDMISCFLGREHRNRNEVNTLNLFALIDPKATWAKRSFHHTNVRGIAFRKLSESPILVNYVITILLTWFEGQNDEEVLVIGSRVGDAITGNNIKFATFSHCLHLFCYCFRYKEGRNIYLQSNLGVTFYEVLKSFIRYLNNCPINKTTLFLQDIFNKHIALFINHSIANSLHKIIFLEPLIELHKIPQNVENRSFPIIKSHTLHLMKIVLQSKIGLENFIYQRFNSEMEMTEVSPVRILLVYCCKCLRNYPDVPLDVLEMLLDCCALICRSPKGLAEIEGSNIISVIAILFWQLKGKSDTLNVSSGDKILYKESYILNIVTLALENFAAVSGRVWSIERERALFPVLQDFYKKPAVPWDCGWFQKLVVSSTLLCGGCEALVAEKVQSRALSNLWKTWSEDDLEHFSGKDLENLQNLLNVFFSLCSVARSVKALLDDHEGSEGTLVEGKSPPQSLQELFEYSLGITEDPCKATANKQDASLDITIASNYQELYLGLRLLRFMLSSLDATLLLQHRFHIQEHLMKILTESLSEESGELIFHDISIICDQILRNYFFIESSYERGVCLTKTPRSSAIPRPECTTDQRTVSYNNQFWSHSRRAPCRLKNDLVKFLGNTRHGLRDINWLSQLRRSFNVAFCGSVSPEIKCNVIMEILEEVPKVYSNNPNSTQCKLNGAGDTTLPDLFPEDLIGIKLAMRYGVKLNLLLPTSIVQSNFIHMLRSSYGQIKIVRNEFLGFDWFLATVFLMCCGNIDRCQLFINNILRLQVAPFLWVTFGDHSQSDLMGKNYRNDFLFLLIEQVELILSIEVPKVFAAFQLSSGSLAVLVHQWMSQCFWNVLEWTEIKNFICIAIIHEPDYMVYFCVAILLHLEPLILHIMSTSAENFWEHIKIIPVTHFHVGKYILFIEKLYKTHHNSVTKSFIKCNGIFRKSSV